MQSRESTSKRSLCIKMDGSSDREESLQPRESSEGKPRGIRLSERMEAVAALVTPGGVLADVGTDHAHLPIALIQREMVTRAIAMDIRPGPLAHARENIAKCGLEDRIETRLCDGVAALAPGEADSIVIAGMGGDLVVHILREGDEVCRRAGELILQPQSRIERVRRFLRTEGYRIEREELIAEDGKYYPMLRAVRAEDCRGGQEERYAYNGRYDAELSAVRAEEYREVSGNRMSREGKALIPLTVPLLTEMEDLYGPLLLRRCHPVLLDYLEKQKKQLLSVREQLEAQPDSERIVRRRTEVLHELEVCLGALEGMRMGIFDVR